MQEGNLWKNIFLYSIPLMFTNLLQIFFNIADVAVAGRFAGTIALGAVGSTTLLISLVTGLVIGMSSGVNSLTALYIGAQDSKRLKQCESTGFVLCLGVGIAVSAIAIFMAEPILVLMKTKDELIAEAIIYFRIYMLGCPALGIYNYGNAVLSASGETKKPLGFLAISGVLNIILNLVFVIYCGMSSAGVALASAITQYLSAILVMCELYRKGNVYTIHLTKADFDTGMLKHIMQISVPSAIQNSLFAVANLFVQSAVNSFDHITVEGNSAAANADGIVYEMMAAFYTATTSFTGQNLGAGKLDRIKKTYIITTIYSFGCGLILGLSLYAFRFPFLHLFTSDDTVVTAGLSRITVMSFSYCVSAFMDNATAGARGLGKTALPTVFVILGTVVFRIIWIYTVFVKFHTINSLYLLYVFAWTFTAILETIYFIHEFKKAKIHYTVR